MQNKTKILLVEDERVIRNFLQTILTVNNYTVLQAKNGKDAITMAASHMPDLLLLDLGLPDMDGMEVLQNLRTWSEAPVIVLSARQDESDKVNALDAGANDYLTKPFGNNELLARIRMALRQYAKIKERGLNAEENFVNGGLRVDYARRLVSVDGNPVHLTPIEYRILLLLSANAGRVLTHDHIIHEIWGPFGCDSQVLRVNMANIRRKIEINPADPCYIVTEVGIGYRMTDGGTRSASFIRAHN